MTPVLMFWLLPATLDFLTYGGEAWTDPTPRAVVQEWWMDGHWVQVSAGKGPWRIRLEGFDFGEFDYRTATPTPDPLTTYRPYAVNATAGRVIPLDVDMDLLLMPGVFSFRFLDQVWQGWTLDAAVQYRPVLPPRLRVIGKLRITAGLAHLGFPVSLRGRSVRLPITSWARVEMARRRWRYGLFYRNVHGDARTEEWAVQVAYRHPQVLLETEFWGNRPLDPFRFRVGLPYQNLELLYRYTWDRTGRDMHGIEVRWHGRS
ncbi:MAG: hypothetical protein L3J76_02975 [Candidatus Hydrothermae bacterium]|nr:hypothetical protein [Candidatus Hydrothermae bacterium]